MYMEQMQIQTTNLGSNTKMSLSLVLPSSPCSPKFRKLHMTSNRIPYDSQSSSLTQCSSYFSTEHVTGRLKARSKRNAAPPQKYVIRASTLKKDDARRSANYQPTVLNFDFIQTLTSPFSVIYYLNSFNSFIITYNPSILCMWNG